MTSWSESVSSCPAAIMFFWRIADGGLKTEVPLQDGGEHGQGLFGSILVVPREEDDLLGECRRRCDEQQRNQDQESKGLLKKHVRFHDAFDTGFGSVGF